MLQVDVFVGVKRFTRPWMMIKSATKWSKKFLYDKRLLSDFKFNRNNEEFKWSRLIRQEYLPGNANMQKISVDTDMMNRAGLAQGVLTV